jgi:hypothetical protein
MKREQLTNLILLFSNSKISTGELIDAITEGLELQECESCQNFTPISEMIDKTSNERGDTITICQDCNFDLEQDLKREMYDDDIPF